MEKQKSSLLNINERLITHIKIVSTKKQKDTNFLNSESMLCTFKAISPFNSWFISKRYSEMKDFYDYLKKIKPKLQFPPFPPKKIFFNNKESTIIERRNAFEELFLFVLQNVEILKDKKLKEFFKIKKNILAIYIKNCILINKNQVSYDLIDEDSSSSSLDSIGSNKSNKSNNEKESEKSKEFENENNNNENKINIINSSEIHCKKSDFKKFLDTKNYFKIYEEFKYQLGNYTSRSQVSIFIIIEFLRNLKIYSSHITEITNDFTDYLKLKNKWKKLKDNEIKTLFLGINKSDLHDDYFEFLFSGDTNNNKTINGSITDKSTMSSTLQSGSNLNNSSNSNRFYSKNIFKDFFDDQQLDGLFYYIGNYEKNYLGAKSALNLLNKIFERRFNPEIDRYIVLLKKIDVKYIKIMNLCKFALTNNCLNQKLCYNILKIYVDGLDEDNITKILTELGADSDFIDKFLENYYIDDNNNNAYNLE
jgi:hypothetical protein